MSTRNYNTSFKISPVPLSTLPDTPKYHPLAQPTGIWVTIRRKSRLQLHCFIVIRNPPLHCHARASVHSSTFIGLSIEHSGSLDFSKISSRANLSCYIHPAIISIQSRCGLNPLSYVESVQIITQLPYIIPEKVLEQQTHSRVHTPIHFKGADGPLRGY